MDLESLKSQTVTGAMPTNIPPCPEGEWLGQIEKLDVRSGDRNDGTKWHQLVVTWNILSDEARAAAGRENLRCNQNCWLDLDESEQLIAGDPTKNVDLGRLREAFGQDGVENWSVAMLEGTPPATVIVKFSPNQNDPSSPFANVVRVKKAE